MVLGSCRRPDVDVTAVMAAGGACVVASTMDANVIWLAVVLIVVLGADAIACIGPIPYIRNDLERLGCSETVIRTIPIVKIAAVVGLVIGLWVPWIGALAAAGMLVYFVFALDYHRRAKDSIDKYLPAVGFMALIAVVMIVSYLSAV